MTIITNIIIIVIVILACFIVGMFLFIKNKKLKEASQKMAEVINEREKDMNQRLYELAILKELGERIGYYLDIEKIVDIITGSLRQFIDYSAVSYMLLEPEKIIFKVDLEKSVSRSFVDDIRSRMLNSLSALLGKEFKKDQVEETLTGAILLDEIETPVSSFFNIPIVIGDKVVGILTVAHTKKGLYQEKEMTILYKITQQASKAVTRLQDVVKTEQGKLNAMVESMTDGVVMTDKDYRIMVVNPAAKKLLNINKDIKEINIFDLIDGISGKYDIRGKLEESVKLDKVLVSGDILLNEKYLQIFISPVKSNVGLARGKKLGGVIIFHDITNEKEAEEMRKDFTSMMVHELRSPLDGIHKMTEMMSDKEIKLDKKTNDECVQMIGQSSGDMLELVNDLLDAAKIESGKFEINKSSTNVAELILGRLEFYKTSAKDKKIELIPKLVENLPADIDLDPLRINQVINNLISNALKFTETGGAVKIQALLHKKGEDVAEEAKKEGIEWFINKNDKNTKEIDDSLIVAVTDNGMGIGKADIPKLFDKFKQFKAAAKSEQKGTGLGLAISKGIVGAHGGIIGVASEEGEGSTFYFTIPYKTKIN